ncbi:MAG TPA: hypothetical protein VKZ18_12435 [Polyangia bacterium]|nr:hypothetical protein [Polyangia bacterium]
MQRRQRQRASDEVMRLGLKAQTLGAAYGRALETQEDNAFAVVSDLLDPTVPLSTSLREAAAFWIQSFKVADRLRRDICETLLDGRDDNDGTTVTEEPGGLKFAIRMGVQATDPRRLRHVPVADAGAITVTGDGSLPPQNVYVSVASNGRYVQLALVDLAQVSALASPGGHGSATLNLPGGATIQIDALRIG